MKAHVPLSVYDEFQYIDAVDKARRWDVVIPGDMTDQYARILAACRGVGISPELVIHQGTCASYVPDAATFIQGYTSADIHSPVYFFLTAWLSWPIQQILGIELITAARLTGIIWLWFGMAALGWMLSRLGARQGLILALPIAIASMPVFRLTNSYVTPDALNLFIATLVLGAAVFYVRGEWSLIPFVTVSMIGGTVKLQNIFAVAAAILFIMWFRIWLYTQNKGAPLTVQHHAPRLGELFALVLMPAIGAFSWLFLRGVLGVQVDRPPLDGPADYTAISLLTTIDDTLLVILAGNGGWGISTPPSIFSSIVLWLLLSGVVATAMFDVDADMVDKIFARSAIVSLLFIGPMTIYVFGVVFSAHMTVLARYVMALVPLLCFPIARRITTKCAQTAVIALAAAACFYGCLFATAN
ncbi:hypothetical protein [Schaalia suimastitidis]|uniref:hypothetical protein n=1 Tax=Schaalia suimastitidis TaxID=121163 RepID=UPI00103F2D33|nr:hypothetical protein [Schaalia suimastitidis]